MSKFNVQQNHPIIPRDQTYVLFRKIVSVHSYDRDIKKWPNSNFFEIDLPEALVNVQSMRLLQITLPNNQYVFTNAYQNTKLQFGVTTPTGHFDFIIQISEGSYTPDQLVTTISNKMNEALATTNSNIGGGYAGEPGYNHFVCKYNEVTHTFWFGNKRDPFTLEFDTNPGYTIPCGQPEVWNHYTKWGLPNYLGYEKKRYIASDISDASGFAFDYETASWLNYVSGGSGNGPWAVLDPSCNLDIFGEEAIYMEVDKYNSIDELEPYSQNTMGLYNNDYAGKINGAFAKIPVNHANAFALYGDSKNFYLMNVTQFSPPIDRIMRLRFTFRYHDGRLVDFKWLPFNFSLEFNMLRDEQKRLMQVRVPQFYNFAS